jgi:hypothetical protein
MCAVDIDVEIAAMYSASEVDIAIGVAIVEDHISDGRAASVWAIVPASIGEFGQVGMWYAVLVAYIVDRIGSGVWVELDGIAWA